MPQQQQQGVVSQKAEQLSKSVAAATTAFAAPAFAANESISDVALANVNILGVIAVLLGHLVREIRGGRQRFRWFLAIVLRRIEETG